MSVAIVYEEHPVCRFAAEELQRYWSILSGELPRCYTAPPAEAFALYLGRTDWMADIAGCPDDTAALHDDGYVVDVSAANVRITSPEARGVLFGVYRLLETAGCRWLFPGPEGEILPSVRQLRFPITHLAETAAYTVRAITDDSPLKPTDAWAKELVAELDWACKNRLNSYYIGGFPARWKHLALILLPEMRKRGMLLEYGGHDTPKLVDRRLFAEKPELFRMVDGQRRADGNFCSSNPEAVQMVVNGIRAMVRETPELHLLHLFFDDVFGGSWCDCPLCHGKSPAEQVLAVINPVADMLKAEFPQVQADFILYHDTLDLSTAAERPRDTIVAYYAPRERCYAHAIGDTSCARNREYWQQLQQAGTQFKQTYVFEYYADMILWNKMGGNIPHVLAQDMKDYYRAGVRRMTMLMFNAYSWFAYPLNMWIYAKTVWNPEADVDALIAEYIRLLFGSSASAMADCMSKKEQASTQLLAFCDYTHLSDIRDIPPQQPEFYRQHLAGIADSLQLLEDVLHTVRQCLETEPDAMVRRRLSREEALLEITLSQERCTLTVMQARFAYRYENSGIGPLNRALDEAIAITQRTKALGAALPLSLIGINGIDKFPGHLCDDQMGYYEGWKADAASLEHQTVQR